MGNGQDIYDEVTGVASETVEIEVREKTTEFDVTPLTRPRKNGLVEALPDGYLEPVFDPEEVDREKIEEMDDVELKEYLEDHGLSMSEVVRSRMLSEEATEKAIECISDAFEHDTLSETQIENMFRSPRLPDDQFQKALQTLIEVSSADEEVVAFREE